MRMRGKAMNIQRFIEKRKARGLSQSELAKGICTQVTVSRFEKNGQVPTLKILIQLCNRLELPLGELF
ncbi:helix-turn-helix domain-containing protein, partial [Enterococcus faecalis]